MTDTPNLGLPFIEGSQAQKHVTHNEALRILDAAIQISVLDLTRTAPPSSPAEGERHVVAAGATGAWTGHANAIATWQDGAWAFLAASTGWCIWSVADAVMFVFDGAHWRDLRNLAVDNLPHLGVNTTASSPNLFSVKSNAALLAAINAADGGSGDVRLQISKESSAKTASVFFSDAFSGRAEFGLVGSDAFRLKVSADGSTWTDAFIIDQTTGNLALPRGLALTGALAPAQITSNQNDYNPAGLATASLLRLNSDASRDVTGLQGGVDGRLAAVFNTGSNSIVLKDENASSSAANRFAFGADITLGAKQSVVLLYDATASRWRPCQPFIAGVSGHAVGYLDGANTWSALQSYTANVALAGMNAKLSINATSGTPSVDFANAGSTVARVVDDGAEIIVASNAAVSNGMYIVHNTSAWTAVSDARLPWKQTARDITENLPSLASLRVYENEVNGRLEMFVKAQEFYHVAPHFVDVGNDDPDYKPTGIPGKQTWGVNYAGGSVLALGYARKHEAELARLADALDLVKTMRAEIDQLKALAAPRQ